ncbi:glycine-rich domain-containing protein [Motilibacter deserti]|uniref:Uncharacterized protein n=1 Tax=Motilibacter deserti TaxID=2714956 RepID=A0ABX0GXR8_9ACTN|nr:hypothetical protein [Motilibacter deserti]NHC15622.1 hypothetical protein [Motilibacter deserti]
MPKLSTAGLLAGRASGRRCAAIDAWEPPPSVLLRFRAEHPLLTEADVALVVAGLRQWFRLAARAPGAARAMPSPLVDDLWHELVLHTRDYADFCSDVLGRFLHHVPESAMAATDVLANRTDVLQATYAAAVADEGLPSGGLPLLFRVDAEAGGGTGPRYVGFCGGAYSCAAPAGVTCVEHLLHRVSADGAGLPRCGAEAPSKAPQSAFWTAGGCGAPG